MQTISQSGHPVEIKVGDEVEVFVELFENWSGEVVLSHEGLKREETWNKLERAFNEQDKVEGAIFGRVKGGFAVDLGGAVAFLPGSQVDIRPVRDVAPLVNKPEPFLILKMDRRRGNIVVSRRAVLEESRKEQRDELLAALAEGQVLDGVVKYITDYGAFVDLGGLDGLLHVTDISWKRVNHPTEVLSVGQQLKVQVIRFNRETQRISLGMKQLEADPWEVFLAPDSLSSLVERQAGAEEESDWRWLEFTHEKMLLPPLDIVEHAAGVELLDDPPAEEDASRPRKAVAKAASSRIGDAEAATLEMSKAEWLAADLIALRAEANERARSLDETLAYVAERCAGIQKG